MVVLFSEGIWFQTFNQRTLRVWSRISLFPTITEGLCLRFQILQQRFSRSLVWTPTSRCLDQQRRWEPRKRHTSWLGGVIAAPSIRKSALVFGCRLVPPRSRCPSVPKLFTAAHKRQHKLLFSMWLQLIRFQRFLVEATLIPALSLAAVKRCHHGYL